ncbi:MAG: M12 family metallo-peptidase [Ferruginibacter sp.]
MKLIYKKYLLLSLFSCAFAITARSQNGFFSNAAENSFKKADQKRLIVPRKIRTVKLDTLALSSFLKNVPKENKISNQAIAPVMEIPMPDGNIAKFHIWETSIMEPELAAAHPNIKTYSGQGIDDPTATLNADWTEFGFHAMILSPVAGNVFIDPYDASTKTNYISYFKKDFSKENFFTEIPPVKDLKNAAAKLPGTPLASQCIAGQLRTYRLAITCTYQYAQAVTNLSNPTKAQVLAKITTTVNRVNSVYEKELDIRLTLVANETNAIFTNSSNDPFSRTRVVNGETIYGANDDPYVMAGSSQPGECQQKIDSAIGNANYDIGHSFTTGTYGYAYLGCVCINSIKAWATTGIPTPTGDPFDIDYVCHEIGHQFEADHSFNNGSACGTTAFDQNAEPGSGSTIMGYAGVCSSDNLQTNSSPQFHPVSFDAITTYRTSGAGSGCGTLTSTGNTAPVVNAGTDYIIPKSTPFVLTGTATDANDAAGALTYSWEQVDVGGPNGPSGNPAGNAPLFRSFPPVSTGVRYFPRLAFVNKSDTTTIGEVMPSYARTMNFRLTVRDNRAGGGGVCFDQSQVTVNAGAGPFIVTSPNTSGIVWYVNDFKTVSWNVANTNAAPISCANVNIQLSTDGGLTFPITLASNTANDGSEEIQVPNNLTSTARIRVIAVGNIFYDMSDINFSIQVAPTASFVFNNPAAVSVCSASSVAGTLKTGSLKSFTTGINLTASLNPAGTTVSFSPNPLTPGNSTTVTLNNIQGVASGTYTVRVTGTAGSVVKTRDIVFIIDNGAAVPSTLSQPANDAIGVSVVPTFSWGTVAGASTYILEISSSSTFTPLTKVVTGITAVPYTLTSPLGEDSVYYWRVKSVSSCGTISAASGTSRFKTSLNSCRLSYDVPKTITDASAVVVTSVINIPATLGGNITDVNIVGLRGNHAFFSDLGFTLTSPAGTTINLFDAICFPEANVNFNINLDDQAATAIACPPANGTTYKPDGLLSAFNGQNSTGTWTLTVTDYNTGDGGALQGWGLSINSNSTNCVVTSNPISAVYTFTGNGNWNVASNWVNNSIPPATLPSGSEIIINHAAGGQCLLNVTQTISAGAKLTVQTGKNLVVPGVLSFH